MTNEPKYKIGDKVFFIKKDNLAETRDCVVTKINVNYWKEDTPPIIEYDITLDTKVTTTVENGIREYRVAGSLEELKDILLKINGLDESGLEEKKNRTIYWYNKYSAFTYKLRKTGKNTYYVLEVLHLGLSGLDAEAQKMIVKVGEKLEFDPIDGDLIENYTDTKFYKKHIKGNN